jgi:hypothetical protein
LAKPIFKSNLSNLSHVDLTSLTTRNRHRIKYSGITALSDTMHSGPTRVALAQLDLADQVGLSAPAHDHGGEGDVAGTVDGHRVGATTRLIGVSRALGATGRRLRLYQTHRAGSTETGVSVSNSRVSESLVSTEKLRER